MPALPPPDGSSWAGETGGPFDLPPGPYRVRVCARGRDAGDENELADEAVDFYLIQLWPAPIEPDAILRVGSRSAEYWHEAWGSNR